MSASSSGPSNPSSPWATVQCRRVDAGGAMQVIQLTVVPPPTPAPARVMIEASHDTLNPWFRYSRSKAESSSTGISGSDRNGPASSTTTERPARAASAAMTPPPAPEPTITMSASRTIASPGGVRRRPAARSTGRIGVGSAVTGSGHDVEPDRPQPRVVARLAGVRVGEEGEQPLEALVRRPPLRDARGRPGEQVRLARRLVEVGEAGRAPGEQQVRGAGLERPEHELELDDLGGVRGEVEGGRREARAPLPVPGGDRLGDEGERPERRRRPADGIRRGRADRSRGCRIGGGGHSARSPCASVLPIVIRRKEVRPMNAVSTLGPPLQPTIARLR